MKRFLLFSFLLSISCFSNSQEMIRNGDFELFTKCPDKNNGWVAKEWKPQGILTPDLFCNCSSDLPEEKQPFYLTNIKPVSGQCMMGFRADVYNQSYYEYFYTFLPYKLEKGKKYNFSFCIQQIEKSSYSVQSIGFLFSNIKIATSLLYQLEEKPQLNFTVEEDKFLTCKGSWVKFESVYEADGDEKYLYIGNFNETTSKNISTNGVSLKNKQNKDWKLFSYYVLDSISLSYLQPKVEEKEEKKDSIISEVLPPLVLLNENFRFNFKKSSDQIPNENYTNLDSLIEKIKTYSNYEIIITGHTDDTGEEKDNLLLSQKRAQSVADYLIKNNIPISKESIIGKGESEPLCNEFKEDCRKLNRRVNLVVQTTKK